ncbi:hypothetical protein [Actinomadura harenae]|uniref:Uncharacterized protein n=1 Tax=Actinomadura harenae TaxID=2483351 RepID=A0A3M2MC41_9ACTN|nr:hypothetical protein [Actinomadura harenae]RMI47061.1 hypothetical protein EBO15_03955 [Actinomadura harenae]
MRARTLSAGVVGLALLAGGCGGGGEDGSSSPPLPLLSRASEAPSVQDGAVEGTGLAGCREARCEVRVRTGDQIELAEHFEAGPLVVTAVEPDRVSMRWTFEGGGTGSGEAGPSGPVTVGSGRTMLTVRVVAIRSDAATLRLTPGDS